MLRSSLFKTLLNSFTPSNFALILVMGLIVTSCRKERARAIIPFDPISTASSYFKANYAELTVSISSSYDLSVFDRGFLIEKAVSEIEAVPKDEEEIGKLNFNNNEVPFVKDRYTRKTNQQFLSSSLIGKVNNCNLNGNRFPSFNVNSYQPNISHLTFSHLTDLRISRDSMLKFSWTPDPQLPESATCLLVVYAQDENIGSAATITRVLKDIAGVDSLQKWNLEIYEDFNYIDVYFIRGHNQILNADGKIIDIHNISYTKSTLYFKD